MADPRRLCHGTVADARSHGMTLSVHGCLRIGFLSVLRAVEVQNPAARGKGKTIQKSKSHMFFDTPVNPRMLRRQQTSTEFKQNRQTISRSFLALAASTLH